MQEQTRLRLQLIAAKIQLLLDNPRVYDEHKAILEISTESTKALNEIVHDSWNNGGNR